MNHYFKPRTPEPRTGAVGIVLRSMICALVVVVFGAGIWMGLDAIRNDVVAEELVDDRPVRSVTNHMVVQARTNLP